MQLSAPALDSFEPVLYLQTLSALAEVDGVTADETAFLQRQATSLGVDLDEALAAERRPLAEMAESASESTRRLVYRDCFLLAHADGVVTGEERSMLADLQRDLGISQDTAAAIEAWTDRLNAVLADAETLFGI